MAAEEFGCQHITGKDAEGFLTFCEAATKPGSSYCPEHHEQKRVQIADYKPEPHEIDLNRATASARWAKNPW